MDRGWHVTLRQIGDQPIARDASERRAFVRLLHQLTGEQLLAFHIVDTHVHLLFGAAASPAETARRIEIAWTLRTRGPGFEPARVRAIRDQHHLANTFLYVLRQAEHHGVHADALREGSSLPDTLGLRLVDRGLPMRVRRELPRLERDELVALLGRELPLLRTLGGSPSPALADAAAASLALPDLSGRTSEVLRALTAAVHACDAGVTEVATALGRSPRSIVRLRALPGDPLLTGAVRGQLRLRLTPQDGLAA